MLDILCPDPNTFISNAGKRFKKQFIGVERKNGMIDLKETGEVDLWEMHNADADECDINNIVTRFVNGDISVLSRSQGMYLDIAGAPKNLREMYDLIHDGEKAFFDLDPSIREKFNNDPKEWFESVGSEEWFSKMEPVKSVQAEGGTDEQAVE